MKPYTLDHVGCYVDGGCGIYATDEIVSIARSHGATITRDCDCNHDQSCFESEFASCEWVGDYEDKASDYMNDYHGVEGAYWGRNENGDWGLWPIED